MTLSSRQSGIIFSIVAVLLVAVLSWMLTQGSRSGTIPLSGQGATATPTPILNPNAYPIPDATEAISRSLVAVPPSASALDTEARLLSRQTLYDEWFADGSNDWLDNAPHWLVGIEVDEMTLGEAMQVHPGVTVNENPETITGMFLLWNATNGALVSSGALDPTPAPGTPTPGPGSYMFTMDKLRALDNESLPISHATAIPTEIY